MTCTHVNVMYTPEWVQVQGLCSRHHNFIWHYMHESKEDCNAPTCINVKPHNPLSRAWVGLIVVMNIRSTPWKVEVLHCACATQIPHACPTKCQTCKVSTLKSSLATHDGGDLIHQFALWVGKLNFGMIKTPQCLPHPYPGRG